MEDLFWLILVVISVYTIIPTLVIRLFDLGVYKLGNLNRKVALTFDDGPDPSYTPLVLNLLKQHNIKATFFVLGSKAQANPEIITRMHQEGHLVGIHNYVHWANALMSPWKVRLQLKRSVEIIESLTGERPVYYRPPWGVINLFDFLLLRRFRMVLWSIMVGDWRSSGGKQKIKNRLLSKLKDGAVIVLHDSGQTLGANRDAPLFMLEALVDFIQETFVRGYSFVRVDQKVDSVSLHWYKRLLVSMWLQWESIVHRFLRLKPIDNDNQLLYFRVCSYQGKRMKLAEDEEMNPGDRVVELHFNNEMLFQMASSSRSMVSLAVQMIRSVKELLPKITEKMMTDPDYQDVKWVYGITMIHRGTSQLGFLVENLPNGLFALFTKPYLRFLLYVIHPEGRERLKVKSDALTPKLIAISSMELKSRYPAVETTNEVMDVEEGLAQPAVATLGS